MKKTSFLMALVASELCSLYVEGSARCSSVLVM